MKNSRSGLARSGQYPDVIEFGKPKSSTLVFQFKGDFSRLLSSSPEQLGQLAELDLADNTITTLPEELKHLENLQKLTLRQNRLEALPEWFFQRFAGLHLLNLGYNKLRTIPAAFNSFQAIKYLYVDHNQLSKFPTEICKLTSLIVLDLSSNNIVALPSEIKQLSNLEELYLQNNDIQKVSESVCSLENLKILNLSNNDLRELTMKLYKLYNLDALQITGNTNLAEPPDNITNKSTPVIMAYLKAKDENKDFTPTDFFRQNSELILKSPRQRTSMIVTPTVVSKSFSKATGQVRSRSRTIGMEDSNSPVPSPRYDNGSVRSGTKSLSKAMAQLVEKFDQGEDSMASSKSSDQIGHSRSNSMVTTPKSGVFKPTRPSLPPQFMGDKHMGANTITDGERKGLRTSVTISTRPKADSRASNNSALNTSQSRAGDSSSDSSSSSEDQNATPPSPPKPRAAHPDDDLSFSASEHESDVELPNTDKNAIPQFEGEIRWMPKGDPKHLMVKAKPENFTIEMGDELNFFDTFAPQNLEVLEADNYEDYKKYFCDKEHLNYVGSHIDKGPVFISIIAKATERGYRTLVRTKDGDFRIHLSVNANVATEAGLKRVLKKNKELPWLGKAKVRLIHDDNFSRDFLDLEQKLVVHAFKMGVVYCKDGQTEEAEMLSNDTGSQEFYDFLNFMGETIDLKDWDKYAGGLDTKKNTTGLQSVYTEYSGSEIMFHVSTLLPSMGSSDDPERIQSKKIHIGNDIVVLFFLDGNGSVSLDSIVSQFNHVYIIISQVPDKYRKMYRVTVASKKGVGQTSPTITGGSIFEKTPEFRRLLLTKIINCERSAYRSMGFEGPLQRMRLHLLRDLAKMYAPKILKEVDKKRRERLHKRKLDSRLTLSTTLYNNKSSRMEFAGTAGNNLQGSKSEVSGVGAGLNESQSMTDASKTQPTDTNELTEVTVTAEPLKASKPKRKLSAGQCMKPMNSTVNVKEEQPKPKKRRGSKSSAKSEDEGGVKDTSKPTLLVEKIDEVDEQSVKVDGDANAAGHRKSLPTTPVKASVSPYDTDPFNINSPRPVSDPNISFTADTQPNTETDQSKQIEADLGVKTDVEVNVETKVKTEERKADGDEHSSSSSSSSSNEADKADEAVVQLAVDAHPAEATKTEDPPAATGEVEKPRTKKRPRPKVKKVDHKKNQQKIHKFFKSLRPKKKKKGLIAEPEMDPGVPEKAT
eukprot:TRINITY_DN1981_c0_g1_i1.p1 TRINITY_DN1981_c0_g1~~TRINITY_DN1981_c0_g1_i1.p1  ORF type:complete len:1210 (-),score=286.78 TRINITY_DN1981_c0_g1_i1:79-3708(-)